MENGVCGKMDFTASVGEVYVPRLVRIFPGKSGGGKGSCSKGQYHCLRFCC